MLPDYPRAKIQLADFVLRLFEEVVHTRLLDISKVPINEGDTASYTRDDGTGETIQFREHRATIHISNDEYLIMSWPDVLKRIEEAAIQMGDNMFRHLLEEIESITKETGNRADFGGDLTGEKLIKFLRDGPELQFDTNGNFLPPTLVGGDVALKALEKARQEISDSRELQEKWNEVINLHRERWRDRENYRKLVD